MKITKIESFAKPAVGLVRITADSGECGWGQIATYEAADIVAECLHRQVARIALGRAVDDCEGILDDARRATLKFPGSYLSRAIASLDTALLDLRAKALKTTVCELLGGTPRPVPVYGSSMSRKITPKDEAARLVRLRDEQGFRAFKIRVGASAGKDQDAWPGRTEEIIPEVRKALGADIVIHADANSCYSPPRALEVGSMLEDNGYGHFEEPCPYWEYDWTKLVTSKLHIPVAGGEQDNYLPAWRTMIRDHVVDIIQPDMCYVGGVTRALEVARLAEEFGMPCTPHAANHSLVSVFTLHAMSAMPNAGPFMELSIEDQSLYQRMYSPALIVRDGFVDIPQEGFGWGVTIRNEWLSEAAHLASEAE